MKTIIEARIRTNERKVARLQHQKKALYKRDYDKCVRDQPIFKLSE